MAAKQRSLLSMTVYRTPQGWAAHCLETKKVFEASTVSEVMGQLSRHCGFVFKEK